MASNNKPGQQGGDARCDAISFQQLLDQETVQVPAYLRENTNPYMGDDDIDVDRYLSRDFHLREKEKLWPHVWQVACREEDIPNPGDHFVYDIVDDSVLVTRTPAGEIKAFINACLHRGRALRHESGSVKLFRCPYHGFAWNLDGEFKGMPCEWDFQHLKNRDMQLPQIRVDRWGGFVFINFDAQAPSLEEFLGVLPEHFARFPLHDYYKAIHVQKVIPCNWKCGTEAFMESFHTVTTHHQILPFTGDANSQYDTFGDNISRSVTPMGIASPHVRGISEQKILNDILELSGRMATDNADGMTLPSDMTARKFVGELNRKLFGEASGEDLSDATLAELQDAILYSAFPNFQVWIGYHGNIVYQFRPHGDDHESCIFDVSLLLRYPQGTSRPPAAPIHVLGDSEPFSAAAELAALGPVFDQDMSNMTQLHKGMKATRRGKGAVSLASYGESRVRHLHQTIDKYLDR